MSVPEIRRGRASGSVVSALSRYRIAARVTVRYRTVFAAFAIRLRNNRRDSGIVAATKQVKSAPSPHLSARLRIFGNRFAGGLTSDGGCRATLEDAAVDPEMERRWQLDA